MKDNMKISITSPQEQVHLKIAEEMDIRDVQEFKFAFVIVCKVMAMYKKDEEKYKARIKLLESKISKLRGKL